MSMIIQHNLAAINTHRNLYTANSGLSKAMEKLSSGYRINVGADGPADLVISEQLRAQAFGLERAVRNTTEATNVINIAEGALNEMNNILKKMKALAIHAANGVTSPMQAAADQAEMDSSIQTLDRIANTTKFSDQQLLNGSKQLTFTQNTVVKGTQQNKLINAGMSSFDQIFRKNDYEVGITFTGTKNADEKTWAGTVDMTKQAMKAYVEIDTASTTLSHVNKTGNLTEENQFILTGSKGSRNFKFDVGTHIGEIVTQIHTTSGSTGVDAALVFNSEQTVNMANLSSGAGAIVPTTTNANSLEMASAHVAAGLGAPRTSTWLDDGAILNGITGTAYALGVDVSATTAIGHVSLLIDDTAWSAKARSMLAMSDGAQGTLNDYNFEFSEGTAGRVKVDVYHKVADGKGGYTNGELVGSIQLNSKIATAGDEIAGAGNNLDTTAGAPGAVAFTGTGVDQTFVVDSAGHTETVSKANNSGYLITSELGGHLEGVVLNFGLFDDAGVAVGGQIDTSTFARQPSYTYTSKITTAFADGTLSFSDNFKFDGVTGAIQFNDLVGTPPGWRDAVSADSFNFGAMLSAPSTQATLGFYGALSPEALKLLNEGTTSFTLEFAERDVAGVNTAGVLLKVNDAGGSGAYTEKFLALQDFVGDLGAKFETDLLKGLQVKGFETLKFIEDIGIGGTSPVPGAAGQTDWGALNGKTLFNFSVTTEYSDAPPVNVDFQIHAKTSADTLPALINHVGNAIDAGGTGRSVGTFEIFGNQYGAVSGATDTGYGGIQGVVFGQNTDGQGRIYIKYTSNNTFELYKDASMTRESLVASGISGEAISECNNSGLSGLKITMDAGAAGRAGVGDLSHIRGTYIAVGGIEGANGAYYGASVNESNLAGDGKVGTGSFDKNATFISGVQLGVNTDAAGSIYTKTVKLGVDSSGNDLVQVFAYKDASMSAESMVAFSEVTTIGAKGGTILLNEVRNRDNTAGTGLAIALSCDEKSFDGVPVNSAGVAGKISFTNLAARVYTNEYGSQALLEINQLKGGLFTYYEDPADFASQKLIWGTDGNSAVKTFYGQDATLSVNGAQVKTDGLYLAMATQDIQARLQFNNGTVGSTTIAQVGYGEGSIFTKIGALQLIDSAADASGRNKFLSGLLCNAGHVTQELIGGWNNGLSLQLGEGNGDQERTVVSIQGMNVATMGKITRAGYWETGSSVMTERTFTMQDVMGGQVAALTVDPLLAMDIIEQAINDVSDLRARLGAITANMLETNASNLRVSIENIQKTEANIRDTDMASEMTEFTKNSVLQNAALSMMAQANAQSQAVLQLLS